MELRLAVQGREMASIQAAVNSQVRLDTGRIQAGYRQAGYGQDTGRVQAGRQDTSSCQLTGQAGIQAGRQDTGRVMAGYRQTDRG